MPTIKGLSGVLCRDGDMSRDGFREVLREVFLEVFGEVFGEVFRESREGVGDGGGACSQLCICTICVEKPWVCFVHANIKHTFTQWPRRV